MDDQVTKSTWYKVQLNCVVHSALFNSADDIAAVT